MKTILSYWKSALATAFILYLSFAPPSKFRSVPPITVPHADKLVHAVMYLVLTAVLIYDHRKSHTTRPNRPAFYLVCIAYPILLGGLVEILQGTCFKPRTADWFDWLADIAGVLIACFILYIGQNKNRKTSRP